MKASFRVLGILMAMSLCAVACSDDKKADGETCTKAEECQSNFCNDEDKCAVQPEDGDSNENGDNTENGDNNENGDNTENGDNNESKDIFTKMCEAMICADSEMTTSLEECVNTYKGADENCVESLDNYYSCLYADVTCEMAKAEIECKNKATEEEQMNCLQAIENGPWANQEKCTEQEQAYNACATPSEE